MATALDVNAACWCNAVEMRWISRLSNSFRFFRLAADFRISPPFPQQLPQYGTREHAVEACEILDGTNVCRTLFI